MAMNSQEPTIQNVSDTALWVAYYRALEDTQQNPVFRDPLAKILIGNRGQKIAHSMKASARYTQWTVVVRTHVIDQMIQKIVSEGVDTVVNLGAGLDTRPYRLALPDSLQWIEVDYPHMIEYKTKLLEHVKPNIGLKRIPLDLADRQRRQELFARLSVESNKILIITEGVILYLTEAQVAELGDDLHAQESFAYWIAEYYSKDIYPYLRTRARKVQLKNAPFQFFPNDWLGFFKKLKWTPREIRYLPIESQKISRRMPMPWWAYAIVPFLSNERIQRFQQRMAYVIFEKNR